MYCHKSYLHKDKFGQQELKMLFCTCKYLLQIHNFCLKIKSDVYVDTPNI